MTLIKIDKSDARTYTQSAISENKTHYYIRCRSNDDGADLDGYYVEEIEVPKQVYLHVKLLEEKLAFLTNG